MHDRRAMCDVFQAKAAVAAAQYPSTGLHALHLVRRDRGVVHVEEANDARALCGDVVLQADRGLRGLCTSSQWRNDGRITERCSLGWCSHVKQTWLSSGCPRRRKRAKLC